MSTRLAQWCERVIEAGWLAALVVTPLFFNLLSARSFEPDKAALLRVIVLVMLAAALARLALGGTNATARQSDALQLSTFNLQPSTLLALMLAIVLVVSALLGLNPRISLLGSYNRDQGVVTLLAYLAVFLLVQARLRTRDQLARLLDTVVLVSLPVAVYALLQRLGVDPVPWGGYGASVTSRVIGTQGNATFLGGYLALAIPVTLYQLVAARSADRAGRVAVYATAVALQALALLLSDSRGAALGLAVGLVVWALAHAAGRGNRRLALMALGVAGAGVVLLVVLNLAGGALQGVPLLGRLGNLTDPQAGSNRVRVLVWQGMSDMILEQRERLALGTGPDAFYLGYYPYFPPALRTIDTPTVGTHDRSHNEVLDRLAATGVVGLGVWLLLVGSLLVSGLAGAGLASTPGQQRLLTLLIAGGAALGALLPFVPTGSLRFSGVGLGVGLVLGLVAWLAWRALRGAAVVETNDISVAVLPMLVGALVVHLVEIQVGIPVTATQTLFWTLAGTLVAVTRLKSEAQPADEAVAVERGATKASARPGRSARPTRTAVPPAPTRQTADSLLLGLVAGLMLATLTFGFIVRGVNLGGALAVLLVLALVTLAAGAVLVSNAVAFLGAAVGVWTVYLILHLVAALPNANPGPAVVTLFVLLLVVWHGLFGWLAIRETREKPVPSAASAGRLGLAALLALLPLLAILPLSLQPTYADMYVRIGQLYSQLGQWPQAVAAFDEATARWPNQDFFLPNVAQAYLGLAQTTTDPQARQAAFERARATLQQASALSPRNPEYLVNLGAAEQYWADKWAAAGDKTAFQAQAAEHYRQAALLAPRDPNVLRRWGRLALDQGNPAQAAQLLERGLPLLVPPGETPVVAQTRQFATEMRADLARAYQAQGRTADAVAQARAALTTATPETRPAVDELLKSLGVSGS